MLVHDARVLAVSRDSSAPHRPLSFVLAEADGTILQRGHLPADIAAEIVIIADYSLLADPELLSLQSPYIDLIAPHTDLSTELDAAAVLKAWKAEGRRGRASIQRTDLDSLQRYLETRDEMVALRDRILEKINACVAAVSGEYFEILSREGRIQRHLLPLLRSYPTPRMLDSGGVVALAQAIDRTSVSEQSIVDRLITLDRGPYPPELAVEVKLAEALLAGDIDRYQTLERQLQALDTRIHRLALRAPDADEHAGADDRGGSFSLFSLGVPETVRQTEATTADPEQLLRLIDETYARRYTDARNPYGDYEAYRAARASLDTENLEHEELVRVEVIGQHLALSAGSFFDAIRYRTACDRVLTEGLARGTVSDRLRADAELTLAITEICAVDFVQGFSSLRTTVESAHVGVASPELLSEALGLMALIIVYFGEYLSAPEVLQFARAKIAEHGGLGAARAAADISDLFLLGGNPDTSPEEFEAVRARADEHSRDTVYRSYFHYTIMLSTYVTKNVALGLHHHALIMQEGVWGRFNRRFFRLARLAYALHLAAQGEFSSARRELNTIETSYESISDGADYLIHGLLGLRLDLAIGRYQHVLAETKPDGPLGEQQIQNVHLRRYAPVSLMLRGTALMREGEEELATDCFVRATQQSVMSGEWMALLAAETQEYRTWLESLDPSSPEGLPGGLTPALLAAVLERPLLIQRTLPALTSQQTRILRLLVLDRSAASIASELHISQNTLKTHMRQLYQRLGVRSREQAVLRAEMYGLG